MIRATRRVLAQRALQASVDVRARATIDLNVPLDVYALCERSSISVRFVGISMEGMYVRGVPPRILISALRPLPRRCFTCAHELGHHVFGHGSTIDELADELGGPPVFRPDEFLVQSFAGFLLMPTVGVRKAFVVRQLTPTTATPAQLLTIACSFGVGFGTLVNHLAYGLEMIPAHLAAAQVKVPPARVRRDLLGVPTSAPLIVVDEHWLLPTLDAEVGMQLLLPAGSTAEGDLLSHSAELPAGSLFDAVRPGITRLIAPRLGRVLFVRIARKAYVGLSQYRHLAAEDDDDEGDDDTD